MIAIIGLGGSEETGSGDPPTALATAFAPSLDAFRGRAKSEKRPRLDNPELMFVTVMLSDPATEARRELRLRSRWSSTSSANPHLKLALRRSLLCPAVNIVENAESRVGHRGSNTGSQLPVPGSINYQHGCELLNCAGLLNASIMNSAGRVLDIAIMPVWILSPALAYPASPPVFSKSP